MGISIWQLLIILLIVVVLFGTKRLRSVGQDLGGAVKGFRDAMGEEQDDKGKESQQQDPERLGQQHAQQYEEQDHRVIDAEAEKDKDKA